MQRALRILSIALITAGLVVLADVGITLAWKEPLSTLYGEIQQQQAEDELADLEQRFSAELASRAQVERRVEVLAGLFERAVEGGEAIGRIEIPSIDLDAVVIEGTGTTALRKGPGRYPETAFPGQGKTIGIAGHRTTYLAPFRNIDEIEAGDEIVLEMPYGSFTYEVEKQRIVEPSQIEIVRDVDEERLVLTACHPLYSAAERYAIFARLDRMRLLAPDQQSAG